jgi:MarR family transcriptional regulator, organic hydroperoxide resistance regulator
MAPNKKSFFHLFMHIGKLLETQLSSKLSSYNLYHGQGRVLLALVKAGAITQANLARGLDIKPATLVKMLQLMEAAKLIERQTDIITNRAVVVTLTSKGKHMVKKVETVWAEIERNILISIATDESEVLLQQLEKIRDTLGGRAPKFISYKSNGENNG